MAEPQQALTVDSQLIAKVFEDAPDRVRRRLDRNPTAADDWGWQQSGDACTIDTGSETVTISRRHIDSLEQVSCTCLLAPRCFHVLACMSRLRVTAEDEASEDRTEPAATEAVDLIEISDAQGAAARQMTKSLSGLLRTGVANAGVVALSTLMRAVHQARAEGLHRLAAIGLRIITGVGRVRTSAQESDPDQLAVDFAAALETARQVRGEEPIPLFWIGTARRQQHPVGGRRLYGLLAEPVMTDSGYAGAGVYFIGEDDQIYTVSEVRPGDAQVARDAYAGGIELGPVVLPAKHLARHVLLGSNLTASADGRLGRGRDVKVAEQRASSWLEDPIARRFEQPFCDQCEVIFQASNNPIVSQRAGWNFVFLRGRVLGAAGPELLFHVDQTEQCVRLAIANEQPALCFRENLRMLCHTSGLKLSVVGRLDLEDPNKVYPLALMEAEGSELSLPESFGGRVFMGLDELQSRNLPNRLPKPIHAGSGVVSSDADPLAALRRRWIGSMLAGMGRRGQSDSRLVQQEISDLTRRGFDTGAKLLHALSSSVDVDAGAEMTFLATAIYLRNCRRAWRWNALDRK